MVKGARVCIIIAFMAIVSLAERRDLGEQLNNIIYNNNGYGTYSFEFKTSDGTYRREDGGIVSSAVGLLVRGEFGYIDPRGRLYAVRYVADANGYQPQTNDDDTRFNDRRMF